MILIQDNRPKEAFKRTTFSNYKKSDVRQALVDTMLRDKIEPACYWCAELLCSGLIIELWEVIFHFMSKYIHLGNPKLPIFIHNRYDVFRVKMNEQMYYNELDIRNDKEIRDLFLEVICILTLSSKKNSLEYLKIDRAEEFDMTKNMIRLKAPSQEYAESVLREKDPSELLIAINELLYHISTKQCKSAFYWVDWVIEYDIICRGKKETCLCEPRSFVEDTKYQSDIIWLVWDAIVQFTERLNHSFLLKTVRALCHLFAVKYTNGAVRRRRFMIYHAITLLTENTNLFLPLCSNLETVTLVLTQSDEIFNQVRENEIIDETIEKSEKQKVYETSMQKLKLLNDFS
jgi:hypothetical protein